MFGNAPKRGRVSKSVASRRPESFWERAHRYLSDRGVQLRLGTCLLTLLLLLVTLQSWRVPFPYRQGDYSAHGIASKTTFERIDVEETERARQSAEDAVPFVFRHDPDRIESLPTELRASLGEVAQSKSLDQLSDGTRQDFGLTVDSQKASPFRATLEFYKAKNVQDRFDKLRAEIVGPDMAMAQQRIDKMVEEFSQLIAPIKETGIVDPVDIQREGIGVKRRILIVDGDQTSSGYTVLLPQVRLNDQLNEAGQVGKSWANYESLGPEIQPALSHWLVSRMTPTLRYDQAATSEAISVARNRVEDRVDRYMEGDLLVRPGQVIDADHLSLLWDEFQAVEESIGIPARVGRMVIVGLLIVVLGGIIGFYIASNEPRIIDDYPRLLAILGAVLITGILGRLISFDPLRAEIVPLLTVVLFISIAYNHFLASMIAFSLALVLTLGTTARLDQFIVLMATSAAAIIPLQRLSSRATLMRVSLVAAMTYLLTSFGVKVVETQSLSEVFHNTAFVVMAIKGAALCLVPVFIVTMSLPYLESRFGIVTDMTLLELSDPSHPLLQDLVRLAPGTYNHSMAVSTIAETAAERIGGNGLLVRVGAYFHDIGKMLKPQYFIENVQADCTSMHENLNPAMSTLVIIGHVKDGIDLAQQYRLPEPIIDFIEQHHGTTLVEYFYREATKLAECKPDNKTDAEEASFRYPGPKPQTKEAAVLMISDTCESACRTLTEPTPKRIETMVNDLVMRRLHDGQFDECELKMTEINEIKASVVKSLIGIYHGRIRYPDQKKATTNKESDSKDVSDTPQQLAVSTQN